MTDAQRRSSKSDAQKRYRTKLKADPARWELERRNRREYGQRRYDRLRADPEYVESKRLSSSARYRRISGDPELLREFLERNSNRRRERMAEPETRRLASEQAALRVLEIRSLAIEALGGACVACGLVDDEVMQFDHKLGDGWKATRGWNARAALKHPDRFELMCANCHVRKTRRMGEYSNLGQRAATINHRRVSRAQRLGAQ